MRDLSSIFNSNIEPYSESQLKRDLKLSEENKYSISATVKKKGSIDFDVPDLSTPLGIMRVEAGAAIIDGFGTAKIKFNRTFNRIPSVVKTAFGFFELKVPWVVLQWKQINVAWWTVNIPIPKLTFMTIRIPSMCFLMNVNKDGFEVFNVLGRTYITYLAIGR